MKESAGGTRYPMGEVYNVGVVKLTICDFLSRLFCTILKKLLKEEAEISTKVESRVSAGEIRGGVQSHLVGVVILH